MDEALRQINRRCWWCGARRRGWDLLFGTCRHCRPYTAEPAPFLSSPPPWGRNSRAEDHHEPRMVDADWPPQASWWIRFTCEHCWHLSPTTGSHCCECGEIRRRGLPVSPCKICDVI